MVIEICICDAGFSIADNVRNIDISLKDNHPGLIEVLAEILRFFSLEEGSNFRRDQKI